MQRYLRRLPGIDLLLWLGPLGLAVKMFIYAMSPKAFLGFRRDEFRRCAVWMGQRGFHLVAIASVFVSIALTIQCVTELQKYRGENLAGAAISIGLLRELGPLTVSLAWCARVSAFLAEGAKHWLDGDLEAFSCNFIAPRYLAALAMSVPLGAYGLLFGFITAALVAPLLGVTSTGDFLESARESIHTQDLVVYFIKLILINPTIGVFAGCAAGWYGRRDSTAPVAANAVTATFLGGYIANLMITIAAFWV
jgi:ABC-type transporter Mla maintaining outer membrane lipid asymmetry permease subunit MlaE